jgi:hypothetical protein
MSFLSAEKSMYLWSVASDVGVGGRPFPREGLCVGGWRVVTPPVGCLKLTAFPPLHVFGLLGTSCTYLRGMSSAWKQPCLVALVP